MMFRKKKAVYLDKHIGPTNTYSMGKPQTTFNAKIDLKATAKVCVIFRAGWNS
jgi:hypothetical protein